jgi:hypothetical protein
MKTIKLLALCMLIIWVPTRAQQSVSKDNQGGSNTSAGKPTQSQVQVVETDNGVIIKLGDEELMKITENGGDVNISLNDSNVFSISDEGNSIKITTGTSDLSNSADEMDSIEAEINSEIAYEINQEINAAIFKELNQMLQEVENFNVDIILDNNSVKILGDSAEDFTVEGNDGETQVNIFNDNKEEIVIKSDTTRIKLGNKGVAIIEDEDGSSFTIEDLDDLEDEDGFMCGDEKKKFKGHYMGFEMGINGLLDEDFSMSRTTEESFMDLNTGKSWNVNLNFIQYSLGFGSDKIGLVTGLGMEMCNYRFDNNNSIMDSSGYVIPKYPDNAGIEYSKSKLLTNYLTVPLLIEWQFLDKPRGKRVFIAAGVVGGLKLKSQSKEVYNDGGSEQKDKNKDDFSIVPLRYGFTARAGYGSLAIWGTYYPVALFEEGKGPELYPFSVGLGLYL